MSTAPALGRRDRKKLATRAALSAAALRLVAEHGLEHVTVEQISEACDVSSRTFFNYFASKDEAVLGSDSEIGGTLELFRSLPADIGLFEALRLAFVPVIHQMEDHRETVSLRMRVVADNPQLLPRLLATSVESELAVAAAVAERLGLPAGHSYPGVAAAVTGAAFRVALMRWANPDPGDRPTILAKLVDEAFDLVASGLTEPARNGEPR
ncbi:DNA-binding transcriptional regulator, AcrR family [Asanoa hainanensis]|uniref:DNA-binding transcriptional regulator, AcrR family n=1 Tax=Asanoa hainanensis TaxID=560556 RepID=A0A239PE84_9ACTN|nr:TetR/AcrR family transcriptional regulator [Asanoa hainanensis]SNT65386.1 DNA-binding transcriptional regulator, AcrR family [Asanoa hainanensis]